MVGSAAPLLTFSFLVSHLLPAHVSSSAHVVVVHVFCLVLFSRSSSTIYKLTCTLHRSIFYCSLTARSCSSCPNGGCCSSTRCTALCGV
jgi:hypothetical protein